MEPIGVKYKSGKGLQIVDLCITCGAVRANKVANNTVQPDELDALLGLPAA